MFLPFFFSDETLLCTLVRSSPLIGYKLLSSRATAGTAHFPLDSVSMKRCTHLVTINPFRRTVNLLRGLLSGVQIVSVDWLKNSAQQGLWLGELSYRIAFYFDMSLSVVRTLSGHSSGRRDFSYYLVFTNGNVTGFGLYFARSILMLQRGSHLHRKIL
ncbi:hypothetical protein CRM22_006251 [Opisthorchis felineus]|uniref:BRCT domain-containing protein n=1 Tax=Opisthorchis felineus TaxID=147828 RepID=A0A4S2LLX9_OPIFE|nr:hypothetical protein CRM22_006251 [Opisthorchis felineus]